MTFGTGACVCDGGWSGASCDDAGSSAKTGTIVAGIAIGAGVMCFVVIALVAVAVVVAYYFVIVPRRKTGRLVTALNRGRDSIATRAPLLDPASQRSSVASRPQSAPARTAGYVAPRAVASSDDAPHHRPNLSSMSGFDISEDGGSTSSAPRTAGGTAASAAAASAAAPHHRSQSSNFGLDFDSDGGESTRGATPSAADSASDLAAAERGRSSTSSSTKVRCSFLLLSLHLLVCSSILLFALDSFVFSSTKGGAHQRTSTMDIMGEWGMDE
jgi:hypothetical protein